MHFLKLIFKDEKYIFFNLRQKCNFNFQTLIDFADDEVFSVLDMF